MTGVRTSLEPAEDDSPLISRTMDRSDKWWRAAGGLRQGLQKVHGLYLVRSKLMSAWLKKWPFLKNERFLQTIGDISKTVLGTANPKSAICNPWCCPLTLTTICDLRSMSKSRVPSNENVRFLRKQFFAHRFSPCVDREKYVYQRACFVAKCIEWHYLLTSKEQYEILSKLEVNLWSD